MQQDFLATDQSQTWILTSCYRVCHLPTLLQCYGAICAINLTCQYVD